MKQRLLLALLMVFASVGLIGAQNTDTQIQISVTGAVRIDVMGSGMSTSSYPMLYNAGNPGAEVAPDGKENIGQQLTYTLTASSPQTFYFVNPSTTNNWSGLTMNVSGQVTSFVVTGSGSLSNAITTLNIQTNNQQTLETLTLGDVSDDLKYMPALRSLSCGNNSLNYIPAKGNLTTYGVYEQYPQNVDPIQLTRNGGDDENKFAVKITPEQLKATDLFSKDITAYTIKWDLTDISATGDVTDGYQIKDKNGIYVDGTYYVTVEMASTDDNYPRVEVHNIPVIIPKAEFSLTTSVDGNTGGTITAYTDASCTQEISSDTKLNKDQHIWIKIEAEEGCTISNVVREGLNLQTVLSEITPGTYEYVVAGTGDANLEIAFAQIEEGDVAIVTYTSDQGEIQVYEQGNDSQISSAKRNATVYAKVKPAAGYLFENVRVVGTGVNQTLSQTGSVGTDGWYTTTSFTIPSGEEDLQLGFAGLFKRGATVDVTLGTGAVVNGEVAIQTSTPTVGEIEEGISVVEPGTEVTIIVPDAATGYQFVSVTNNGKKCDEGTAGTYETTLEVGVNNIEVTYEDIRATQLQILGIDKDKVTVKQGQTEITNENISSLIAGQTLTITFKDLNADEKVAGVSVNGQTEDTTPEYTGAAVAGINTIFVRMVSNPTLGEPVINGLDSEISHEGLVTVKEGDTEIDVDGALSASTVTIEVKDVTGYKVERVLFNGVELTKASDVYTGDVVDGLNIVTVYYKSTEVGNVEYNYVDGDESWITTNNETPGQVTISASASIEKGKGIQTVLLNALNSENETGDYVDYDAENNSYKVTLQPGNNLITVVFTDKAMIAAHIEGIDGYSGIAEIEVTNPSGGNVYEGTYNVGDDLQFTVAAIKEYDGISYNLKAVYVNGKTAEYDGDFYTDELAVGTNHIVAVYESQAATVFEPVVFLGIDGAQPDITYYVGDETSGSTSIPTGLNADDKLLIAIGDAGNNTLNSVYFNNEQVFESDGKYELEIQKGTNYLYAFYNDAAKVKTVVTDGGTITVSPDDAEMKEGVTISATIEVLDGYRIKAVYFNGENVKDQLDGDNELSNLTVQSGLNIIHAEFEYVAATVNLTYNSSIGSVTADPELDPETNNTNYEAGQTITITPQASSTDYQPVVTFNGSEAGVTDNRDGTYSVTLVAGENNINVEFKKQLEGNLLVKYDSNDLWDLTVTDQNGNDVTEPAANGEIVNAPAKTLLDITFKVGNSAADLVGKKVTAVINGKPYTAVKMNPDGDNTFEINDVILPEGLQSVLKVYVKTLDNIELKSCTSNYTYDGTPKAVEYVMDPVNPVGMTVDYSSNRTEWRDEPFTDAGTYFVRFYRPADDVYAEVNSIMQYTIEPAEVVITDMPTVSVDSDNHTYILSGGAAGYKSGDTYIPVEGEFAVIGSHSAGSHKSNVSFTVTDDNAANFTDGSCNTSLKVCYQVNSYRGTHYTIVVGGTEVPFQLMRNISNEAKVLITNESNLLDGGDPISLVYEQVPGFTYKLYRVNADGTETQVLSDNPTSFQVDDICDATDNQNVTLIMKSEDTRHDLALNIDGDNTNTFEVKEITYDGTAHPFTANNSSLPLVYINGESRLAVSTYPEAEVTYTLDGVEVPEPVDAGVYTITVHFPANTLYREYTAIGTFEIEKAELTVIKDPVTQVSNGHLGMPIATPIAAGQYLYNSVLAGAAEVPGEYRWEDESTEIKPGEIGSGGVMQNVVFVPLDTENIDSPVKVGAATIEVLENKQIVTWRAVLGEISVVDANGNSYDSGDPVRPGTILTITAKPLDDTMQEFESMKVTVDNETTTVSSASTTIKVPDEGIVEVYATFKLKDNSSVIEVPTGQCAIVLPTNIRGAKLSKTGVQMVNRGESFTFTVSTLDADKDKVVVSVNGTAIQPANGVYTISNITEQQNVSVSLTSKTEVKLDIPKEYKLKDGTLIGRVTVVNNTSSDGKVYYNDELTLIAQPVEGVNFSAWSDGNKEDVRKYTVATSEVKLTASFSGVPTGIEDIESASILAGDGYILIKNVADANVTIVGMTGRIQAQQQISGDTQIRVPAGIYVVILENGQDVKQVKVIVR